VAQHSLARNILTGRHVAIMAMAATGPAASAALNFGVMAGIAGPAYVLAFVLTLAAVLLLASSLVQFSHRYPSAGSIYTWVSRSLGHRPGFVVGWLFAGSYVLLSAAGSVVLGYWGETLSETLFDHRVPWWAWTLAGLAFIAVLAFLGVSQSTRSMLVLFSVELAVILVLAVWILVSQADSWTLETWKPSSVPGDGGWAAIGLAMTFGVLSCVGMEEATTLAEETRDAKRAVARGVLVAAVAMPATYVVASYAITVGLGPDQVATAENGDPLGVVTEQFWGEAGLWVVFLAVLSSILAFTQTAFNAGVRVLYALGRERLLPARLGTVHPRHRTPHVAVVLITVLSVVIGFPLAIDQGALQVWVDYGFMISLMFLMVYAVVNVALVVDTLRNFRAEFRPVRHAVLPALGFCAMVYPLYRTVWPVPQDPFPLLGALVLVWLGLGVVALVYLSASRPDSVRSAGLVMGELVDPVEGVKPA
jgi:amino acid transporter